MVDWLAVHADTNCNKLLLLKWHPQHEVRSAARIVTVAEQLKLALIKPVLSSEVRP